MLSAEKMVRNHQGEGTRATDGLKRQGKALS